MNNQDDLSKKLIFCKKCGEKNDINSKVCGFCNNSLDLEGKEMSADCQQTQDLHSQIVEDNHPNSEIESIDEKGQNEKIGILGIFGLIGLYFICLPFVGLISMCIVIILFLIIKFGNVPKGFIITLRVFGGIISFILILGLLALGTCFFRM